MGNGKIIFPTKFQVLKNKVKSYLGQDIRPEIYIDGRTLIKAFMQSDLWQSFNELYPIQNMAHWNWDVQDGVVKGIRLTKFKEADPQPEL